ncbi:hypothetical protein OY671_010419, partial [Metschnikowia pulcherrima]
FGTFQRAAYYGRKDQIEASMEHARSSYHPAVAPGDAAGFSAAVVEASAASTAKWIAAGFVHGVSNTDNSNVTGESFDYGPWRFLPVSEPGFTAAYFDETGLYAYGRQPDALFWNVTRSAESAARFITVSDREDDYIVARYPVAHSPDEAAVDAFKSQLREEHGMNEPGSSSVSVDSG